MKGKWIKLKCRIKGKWEVFEVLRGYCTFWSYGNEIVVKIDYPEGGTAFTIFAEMVRIVQ